MNVLRNLLDKHLFVSLLATGVMLSIIARKLPDDPLSIFPIGVCLICLIIYTRIAWCDNSGLHNPDNLYYMGLLFTLSSLVYSLVTLFLLNNDAGDIAQRTYNLIGSFGIALISTFCGILFRILLLQKQDFGDSSLTNQLKGKSISGNDNRQPHHAQNLSGQLPPQRDFESYRQSAHADLTETARKLRMELTQTIADMHAFRGAIIQANDDTVRESNKARTAMIQQIEKTTNEQARILSTLSTTTVDKLTAILTQISQHTTQEADKARIAMVQQIEETANEQTRILSALSTTTVDGLTTTINGITTSVESVQESLDTLADQQVKRVQQSIALSEKSTRELEIGVQASLNGIAKNTTEIATAFDTILAPLQSVVGDLQSTSSNTRDIFNQYASLNSALQQSLAFFADIENQMEQAANTLTVSTEAFSGSLSTAVEVAPQYTQQFEQLIKTLRQEAEQWQSMTQEVRSSLVQAIDELTQLVKRN